MALSFLGTLGVLGVGAIFYVGTDRIKNEPTFKEVMIKLRDPRQPEDTKSFVRATFGRYMAMPHALFGAALLGLVGFVLLAKRRGIMAAPLLILAAVGPAAMLLGSLSSLPQEWQAITPDNTDRLWTVVGVPGALLGVSGLIALLVRPKQVIPPSPTDEEDDIIDA